ncbi:MAG TPA: protein kinase [Polyangiaceae bacterium]|nr:protein kinase [Polyangiaceae bacterium]
MGVIELIELDRARFGGGRGGALPETKPGGPAPLRQARAGSELAWSGGTVQAGDLLSNKYRLEGVLGSGGMSVVWAATHELLRGRVALKLLSRERAGEPRFVRRFLREARWAAKLRSRHTARVYDADVLDDGTPYIVMELLEGVSLGQHLRARGPLPVREAVGWALQVCSALDEAHGRGLVHRDLKPPNLFLADGPDGSRTLKVLDFGIAKHLGPSTSSLITAEGTLLGSPSYMAPEQVSAAGSVDARADLWALGVLLFEMLSGQKPFTGPSLPETLDRVLRHEPPNLLGLRAALPPGLVAVVRRCLEKDRERRFDSATAVASALAPFRDAASAAGPPPALPFRRADASPAAGPLAPSPEPPAAIAAGGHFGGPDTPAALVISDELMYGTPPGGRALAPNRNQALGSPRATRREVPRAPRTRAGYGVSSLADTLPARPPSPPAFAKVTPTPLPGCSPPERVTTPRPLLPADAPTGAGASALVPRPPAKSTVDDTAPLAIEPGPRPGAAATKLPAPYPVGPAYQQPGGAGVQALGGGLGRPSGSGAAPGFDSAAPPRAAAVARAPRSRHRLGYWLVLAACALASGVSVAFVQKYANPPPIKARLRLPSATPPAGPAPEAAGVQP